MKDYLFVLLMVMLLLPQAEGKKKPDRAMMEDSPTDAAPDDNEIENIPPSSQSRLKDTKTPASKLKEETLQPETPSSARMCMEKHEFKILPSLWDSNTPNPSCHISQDFGAISAVVPEPAVSSPFRGSVLSALRQIGSDMKQVIFPPEGENRPEFGKVSDHIQDVLKSLKIWQFFDSLHPLQLYRGLYFQEIEVQLTYPHPRSVDDHPTVLLFDSSGGENALLCSESRTVIPTSWLQWSRGEASSRLAFELNGNKFHKEVCQFRLSPYEGSVITMKLFRDNERLKSTLAAFQQVPVNFTRRPGEELSLTEREVVPIIQIKAGFRLNDGLLRLAFTLVAVLFLHPVLVHNKFLQFFVALMFGTIICLVVMVYFTTKDLSKSTVGKVGIFTLVGVGGWAALIEGMGSAALTIIMHHLGESIYLQIGSALVVLLLGWLTHKWFAEKLKLATDYTLWFCSLGLKLWFLYFHPELSFGFVTLWTLLAIVLYLTGFASILKYKMSSNEPQDYKPAMSAGNGAWRRPIVSNPVCGKDKKDVFKAYERAGKQKTDEELNKLLQHLDRNPHKLRRLKNPNVMSQWMAGYDENDAIRDEDL